MNAALRAAFPTAGGLRYRRPAVGVPYCRKSAVGGRVGGRVEPPAGGL